MKALGWCTLLLLLVGLAPPAIAEVDLAVGFDQKTNRPNLFIAWRNTQRILEVELEVKNYGDEQATGELMVSILDEEGRLLDSSPGPADEPILVTLPPAGTGGTEGKIVQMHGSKSLNLLIDRLDRANHRYLLRAEILNDSDVDRLNNVSVKSFNVSSRARPGCVHFFDYYFRNTTDRPLDLRWSVDSSPLPADWRLSAEPADDQTIRLAPGELVQGWASLATPEALGEGDHVDIRFVAIDQARNQVFGQSEWFVVYDVTPPEISGAAYSVDEESGLVEVSVTANDTVSMLKEASGVRVEYSTDGGVTFSNRVLAYLDGNFVGPTRFRGELGPFAEGTEIAMSLLVQDIAGNTSQRVFEPIIVRHRADATAAGR